MSGDLVGSLGVGHILDVKDRIESALFTPQMRYLLDGTASVESQRLVAELEGLRDRTRSVFEGERVYTLVHFFALMLMQIVEGMPETLQKTVFGETFKVDQELAKEARRFMQEMLKEDEKEDK